MTIDRKEGRQLFGVDTAGYSAARPGYPREIYDFLAETGAIFPDAATLEIGAGNGLATGPLLTLGADPLTVIEPDGRFAPRLSEVLAKGETDNRLITGTFEDVDLPPASFDLVCSATAFHWLDQRASLAKAARLLRSGGHIALWWNVFGDPARKDPFHEATLALLSPLASGPSGEPEGIPFALDVAARRSDLRSTGTFDIPAFAVHKWTLTLNTAGVGALYGTFSNINRLEPSTRASILGALMEIADREFGGVVERNMVSPIYVARRR